jgi:hypothetical protein
MKATKHRFTLEDPAMNEILLSVQTMDRGGFGVYADFQLIVIHSSQAAADAHCQRLLRQQVGDVGSLSYRDHSPAQSEASSKVSNVSVG